MITSMTGFGRGEAGSGGFTVTAELKSVNSRYLDISMRLPQAIQERELDLKEIIQQYVQRGKINLYVRLDQAETGEPEVTFNRKLVKGYKIMLDDLRETAGIEKEVTLEDLLQFSDIFESREQDEATLEKIWNLSVEAAREAGEELRRMRRQEGTQLKNDLQHRIDHIEKMMNIIGEHIDGRAGEIKEELLGKINQLIESDTLDPDRLEMEVAILVDKMDITEEIVRTRSHIKFFREALEKEEAVGRRLNFLSQELNREINTIGSKANSSDISQYVVQAKESLEQIREQVQNVE